MQNKHIKTSAALSNKYISADNNVIYRLWSKDPDTEKIIKPKYEIDIGEEFYIETINAFGKKFKNKGEFSAFMDDDLQKKQYNHPITGPILVKDADNSHSLAIHILEILPKNALYCLSKSTGMLANKYPGRQCKIHENNHNSIEIAEGLNINARPSIGVLSTVNDDNKSPGRCSDLGGNLDFNLAAAGSVVYLPVNHDQTLLAVGDVHFIQGSGEVSGLAIECDSVVKMRVEKVPKIPYSVIENNQEIAIIGWGNNQQEAQIKAVENSLDYLKNYSTLSAISKTHIYQLLGGIGDLICGNISGKTPTFAIKIDKTSLNQFKQTASIINQYSNHEELLEKNIRKFDNLPIFHDGDSRQIRKIPDQSNLLIAKLKNAIYSYNNKSAVIAPKTATTRAAINQILSDILHKNGIKTSTICSKDEYILMHKESAASHIEVVVKAALVGSAKHSYHNLNKVTNKLGNIIDIGQKHTPYVRFDWRNPHPKEDAVMPHGLANYFIDVKNAEILALKAFNILTDYLEKHDLGLNDCCLFMNKNANVILGEVSPDNLGTIYYTGKQKELEKIINNKDKSNIAKKWQTILNLLS